MQSVFSGWVVGKIHAVGRLITCRNAHKYVYIYVVLTAVCMSSFISTDMVDSRLGRDLGSRMKKVRARSMA